MSKIRITDSVAVEIRGHSKDGEYAVTYDNRPYSRGYIVDIEMTLGTLNQCMAYSLQDAEACCVSHRVQPYRGKP